MNKNDSIAAYLRSQSLLKQDVYEKTRACYNSFKEIIRNEIETLREEISEERVRLTYDENGDFETHAYTGSDVLVFNMHTNVFTFHEQHPIWNDSYLQEDRSRSYFGIIHIYNFLAESFLQGRMNDAGYLLGRIFINKDGHFFIEGKEELGVIFRNVRTNVFDESMIKAVFQVAVKLATQFDLHVPPFANVSIVDVQHIKEVTSTQEMRTGKRLGFKY